MADCPRCNPEPHRDGFCEECGVSLDLHYDDSPGSCAAAAAKADLMDAFYGMFIR